MLHITLEEGLSAYRCPETGGHYIPAQCYWRWLVSKPERLPRLPAAAETEPSAEPCGGALICPETGAIMLRFRVGHGFEFSIDRSITGGIWLDAGEWEALRNRNFHDEIHLVFTAPWQRGLRESVVEEGARERLEDRLGSALLEQLDNLKVVLADHPHKELALGYLSEILKQGETGTRGA